MRGPLSAKASSNRNAPVNSRGVSEGMRGPALARALGSLRFVRGPSRHENTTNEPPSVNTKDMASRVGGVQYNKQAPEAAATAVPATR